MLGVSLACSGDSDNDGGTPSTAMLQRDCATAPHYQDIQHHSESRGAGKQHALLHALPHAQHRALHHQCGHSASVIIAACLSVCLSAFLDFLFCVP